MLPDSKDLFAIRDCRHLPGRAIFSATRFYNGPQQSTAQTREDEENNQSTVGDTGAGAVAVSTGAAGETNLAVTYQNVDPELVNSLGNSISSVANTAVANNSIVAIGAENAATTDIANALGFGAEALQENSSIANNAVDSVTQVAVAGQQEAQATTYQSELTTAQIASELAQITANSAPQTGAAESEILSGYTPTNPNAVTIAPDAGSPSQWETWAIVGGFLLSLYVVFRTKGKST